MNIPDDCFFAYTVMHEAFYASVLNGKREISVSASAHEGGCLWEFMVEEVDLGGHPNVKVNIFDDAFDAFAQIPEFFARLTTERPTDLKQVARILDDLGARDTTERIDRDGKRLPTRDSLPRPLVQRLTDLGWTPPTNGGAV